MLFLFACDTNQKNESINVDELTKKIVKDIENTVSKSQKLYEDKEDDQIEIKDVTEEDDQIEIEEENIKNQGNETNSKPSQGFKTGDLNNCPQDIYQEFTVSFKEKFSDWQYVTLIDLSCSENSNGIKLFIKYRSLGTTALKGWFADTNTLYGSARKIFQSAFNFSEVINVTLYFYNIYKDEFGNIFYRHEVTMEMNRDLAEKINWSNFDNDMLRNLLNKYSLIKLEDGEEIRVKD